MHELQRLSVADAKQAKWASQHPRHCEELHKVIVCGEPEEVFLFFPVDVGWWETEREGTAARVHPSAAQ